MYIMKRPYIIKGEEIYYDFYILYVYAVIYQLT